MSTMIKRESLVAQVVDIMRRDLPCYKRFKWLPGERVLCKRFHVSRTTLRTVLAKLQRQGFVQAVPSKGYRLLQTKAYHLPQRPTHVIGSLQEDFFTVSESQSQTFIRNIEHTLNTLGYEMIIESCYHLCERDRYQRLAGIVAAHPVACWALNSVSQSTQRWFAQRKIPTLVLGSCYPGIDLPNMEVDYRAVCRHAVGMLWRLGHRRIALLSLAPYKYLGGDMQSELGFIEGWHKLFGKSGLPLILEHDGSKVGIRRALTRGLAGSVPFTALLVLHSSHALTAAGFLLQKGFRLPADISLVCRCDDDALTWFVPSIAHYTYDRNVFARRFARALIQLASAGCLQTRPRLMMADFVAGETLAPPGMATGRSFSPHRSCPK